MNIKFLIATEEHLDDIYNLIAEKSEQAAIDLYNDLLDGIERLQDFPQIAFIEPILADEPQKFRSLVIRHNYKAVYYIEDETIYIAAVWDCWQSPKTNARKIKE